MSRIILFEVIKLSIYVTRNQSYRLTAYYKDKKMCLRIYLKTYLLR